MANRKKVEETPAEQRRAETDTPQPTADHLMCDTCGGFIDENHRHQEVTEDTEEVEGTPEDTETPDEDTEE